MITRIWNLGFRILFRILVFGFRISTEGGLVGDTGLEPMTPAM